MSAEVLHGIKVLDFTRYRAGPTCTQLLADMGAEVIRVERPGGEDDRRLEPFPAGEECIYLAFTSRNKKGITLNLIKEKSKEILKELVKRSDVVIEAYGPNVNSRLGLDYESLKKIKPDIIVVAVSGFGQYGPYAKRLGYDGVAQAMSGLMSITGFPENPPTKFGVSAIDTTTGIFSALGTLLALYHREKTGEGQLVDTCLSDTAVFFMESYIAEYIMTKNIHPRIGNAHSYVAPTNAYKAKDGYFFIQIVGSSIWKRFLKMTDREELANDPRFSTDYKRAKPENQKFFADWIGKWAASKTVAEVVRELNEAGVPCGPVNTIPQVATDPHVQAREMLPEIEHPKFGKVPLIGIPIKLSRTPGKIKTTYPMIGEHNKEIYCEWLGYTLEQLAKLKEEGVV